jgi:hypothetical protein
MQHGQAKHKIRNPKHLPCGIQPLAGPRGGIPQGEHETNPEEQMWDMRYVM